VRISSVLMKKFRPFRPLVGTYCRFLSSVATINLCSCWLWQTIFILHLWGGFLSENGVNFFVQLFHEINLLKMISRRKFSQCSYICVSRHPNSISTGYFSNDTCVCSNEATPMVWISKHRSIPNLTVEKTVKGQQEVHLYICPWFIIIPVPSLLIPL